MADKGLVCVTGAAGYIGIYVCKAFLDAGYKVNGTVRNPSDEARVKELRAMGVTLFAADLASAAGFDEAFAGCKFVLHTAAPLVTTSQDPENEVIRPMMEGVENVLRAAKRAQVGRVVMTSSMAAVCGDDKPPEHVWTEADWNDVSTLKSLGGYSRGKYLSEKRGWEVAKELGLVFSAVCPSFVTGPALSVSSASGSSSVHIMRHLTGAFKDGVPSFPFGFVDIRDVARAHLLAAELPQAAGERFLVNNVDQVNHLVFAQTLAKVFPSLRAVLGTTVSGTPVTPRKGKCNNSKSIGMLGLKYTPLAESLRDHVRSLVQLGLFSLPRLACRACGGDAVAKCSRCEDAFYCGGACQRADWAVHRASCQEPLSLAAVPTRALLEELSGRDPGLAEKLTPKPVRVLITGAAGQIGYSLAFGIARGEALGPSQPVILHLLEVPQALEALQGVAMELQDCAFPLLHGVVATADLQEAFTGVDVALFVGAMPRREGMERKDLLQANAKIFEQQGKALDAYAKKTVKCVVVGNPANTNCLTLQLNAPSIPATAFSALTRLDHNRAQSQIAAKAGVDVKQVKNLIIWGNHSSTQYPDVSHGTIVTAAGPKRIREVIRDEAWLQGEFVKSVQQRGAAVIAARKLSSAASAANAILNHVRDWMLGTPAGEWVSMAVPSDGSYGIPAGVIYSYPVITAAGGSYSIVQNLPVSEFSRGMMDKTYAELKEEADTAAQFLSAQKQ